MSLSDIIELKYGKSLPEKAREPGPFKVYGSNGAVGHHKAHITGAPAIVVGRKGSIGEVHFSDEPCFPIDTTYYVDHFDGVTPHFVRHLLRALPLRDMNRATAIPGLNREDAYALPVQLPPLPEQRRIAVKIDSLLGKSRHAREQLDHIPRLVEKYKQSVLDAAVIGQLSTTSRDRLGAPVADVLKEIRTARAPIKRLARRMRCSAIHETQLPDGWGWVSPDEVADDSAYSIGIGPFGSNLVKGDYRECGVRLVFVRDIVRQSFAEQGARYVSPKKAEELAPHVALPGDVLITKMGEPPGETAVYPHSAPPAVITADCIKLRPDQRLATGRYLMYAICSSLVRNQIRQVTKGVAQQKISLETFRQLALPIPPMQDQKEIVRRIDHAHGWINRLAAEACSARKLVDRLDEAILAKALRGELVPQNPTDEPANVLLDKIRAQQGLAESKTKRRLRKSSS